MRKSKFRELTPLGKLKFIFCDHFCDILLGGFLLLIVGTWLYLDFYAQKPALNVEMVDGSLQLSDNRAFDEFLAEEGRNLPGDKVNLDNTIQMDLLPDQRKFNITQLFFCKHMEGRTDLYFWDDENAQDALMRMNLVDLRTILSQETLEKCGDRLIYTGPMLQGGFPYGIRLDDCDWVKDHGFYGACSVGISKNAVDPELAAAFIEYIL